jgi:two-component system sensor histidine kinase ChvG
MASATVTGSPDPASPGPADRLRGRLEGLARRGSSLPLFGTKLGRLILGLQLLGLLVLIVGALVLNEFRRNLITARLDSLNTQAAFIANVLDRAATVGDPEPALDSDLAAQTLQLLFIPRSQRARLFDGQGRLIADSYVIGDRIEERPLPPARRPGDRPAFWRPPGETEPGRLAAARAELAAEVARALKGEPVADVRRGDDGRRRVSVSLPIQHVRAVLGVLVLEAGDVDDTVWAQRRALIPFILIAVGSTLASSILLHVLVARPILRLQRAADSVRLQRARAISLPDIADRQDEVGDLTRALESMTDTLSTRMDAIERFAADVAHEIKNPLTSIRSAVETLEIAPDGPGRARLIAILKADGRRLDRLVTDIANASRLDAELSREAPRPVDLGRLAADVAGLYAETAAPVVVTTPPETLRVQGREGPLGQVLRNLVDNARSFSPPDRPVRVAVTAEGLRGSRRVRLTVEDDGPGVPPENLETIFERFYTQRPKGTGPGGSAFGGHSGLGLSISRQIAAAHGGRLWAENRVDAAGTVCGARFVLDMPEAAA